MRNYRTKKGSLVLRIVYVIIIIILLFISFIVLTKITQKTYVTATIYENKSNETEEDEYLEVEPESVEEELKSISRTRTYFMPHNFFLNL